ncbi:MAG: hypothetical protein R3C44_04015 [Chloroflexota bacterium]
MRRAPVILVALGVWLLLSACAPAATPVPPEATPLPVPVIAEANSTPTPAAEPTATATLEPTITATSTPLPTATPTPLPPLTVSTPLEWAEAVQAAVNTLQTNGQATWDYTVEISDEPADIALVHDTTGTIVRQEPIALAVPFTTNWEYATRAEGMRSWPVITRWRHRSSGAIWSRG